MKDIGSYDFTVAYLGHIHNLVISQGGLRLQLWYLIFLLERQMPPRTRAMDDMQASVGVEEDETFLEFPSRLARELVIIAGGAR